MASPAKTSEYEAIVDWDPQSCGDAALDRFLSIWKKHAKPNHLPKRSDFDIRTVAPFAGDIAIVSVGKQSKFRFELVGSHLDEYAFVPQTGKELAEVYRDDRADFGESLAILFGQVVQRRCPVSVLIPSIMWAQGLQMRFLALHLPLSLGGTSVERILSVLRQEPIALVAHEAF
jgi:hypothetical protein